MTAQCQISFREWISSVSRTGINGHGEEKMYVPATHLRMYWSEGHLREIINTINPVMSVPFETIIEQYARVFSILVFIGQTGTIDLFLSLGISDNTLPLRNLRSLPDEWQGGLDEFIDKQWPFCPWVFADYGSDKRKLLSQQILPIRYKDPLETETLHTTEAQVRIVNIDDEYCLSIPQEVVFKIYKGSNTIQLYNREADVYTRLRRFNQTAITQCYGSLAYTETNTRIIILEHARLGSLDKLFLKSPPVKWEDYKLLWMRLLNLFEGLHLLHNPDENDCKSLSGIHQDIQPANILVFPGGGTSVYDVFFKLADFGLTEVVRSVAGEGATIPINNEGNRMYSAPEAYPSERIASEARPHLNSLADLWSLGAVFSDFLVWSIGGHEHRESYRIRRKDAVAKLPHLQDHGFVACFHDGINRLPEVDAFHEETLKSKREGDFLSPCMSEFIFTYLMVQPPVRLSALQAKGHATLKIAKAQLSPIPQRSKTPDSTHPPTLYHPAQPDWPGRRSSRFVGPNRDSYFGGETKVTAHEVYCEIIQKTSRISFLGKGARSSDAGMDLSGMQTARNKVHDRNGRDEIFVIDDSHSMRDYKIKVAITARVISYTVKVSDKDGMDLYFASDSCNPQKCRSSSDVEKRIKKRPTVNGFCDMNKCLHDVMLQVEDNGMQPTSIYVFTDGVWNPNNPDHEVDSIIRKAIKSLVDRDKKPTDLMFQFIQFGRDDEGSKRLKALDDGCKVEEREIEYDIVDTKHCDDHVPKIIIGSLSRHNDNDD